MKTTVSKYDRFDGLEDVSKVSGVSKVKLEKLAANFEDSIAHSVAERKSEGSDICYVNVGFGYLRVESHDDTISYKFRPTKRLHNQIIGASRYGSSPIEVEVEKALINKVKEVYKDLS